MKISRKVEFTDKLDTYLKLKALGSDGYASKRLSSACIVDSFTVEDLQQEYYVKLNETKDDLNAFFPIGI